MIPDGTTLTPNPGSCEGGCTIIGGTPDLTGTNLFHSFTEFSVPTGGTVVFDHNPAIQNILTRVTGGNRSEVDGIIRTNITSNANLFLLNPNGIFFGPNGALDIGGSFVATTADAIQFDDQGAFSAFDTDNNLTLLTVNPSAFLFNQDTTQPIINQSLAANPSLPFITGGLSIREGKSLLLLGGNIVLEPSSNNSFGGLLTAFGGQIELGGVVGPSVVDLISNGNSLSLSYEEGTELADISLNSSQLNISSLIGNEAGSITINASDVTLANGSSVTSETLSQDDSGDIFIRADNSVVIENNSSLSSLTFGSGSGGNIEIIAKRFALNDGSGLIVSTFALGDAGEISIDAETVSLNNNVFITSEALGEVSGTAGNPGEIQIITNTLSLTNAATITALTNGNAVDVQASGLIDINAADTVSLADSSVITSGTFGQRDASNIEITTNNLIIQDSAGIFASANTEATSAAGKIDLDIEHLTLSDNAQIISSTNGEGDAGSIFIRDAQAISISDSIISTETNAAGNGGDIDIEAQQLVAENEAGISARSTGSGPAGDITLRTSERLAVEDGAQIEVSGEGSGNSGMLKVISDLVVLENGQLLASVQEGNDGNILLEIEDALILRDDSLISAEAFNDANGGNVDIITPFIIALSPDGPNGNDIQASAIDGDGGRITIQANTLFGIEESRAIDGNMTNNIDASSEAGIDGEVIIETLQVDPDEGIDPLPNRLAVPEIGQGCQTSSNGQFVATGRGGLTASPYEPLSSDGIQDDIYPVGQGLTQPTESRSTSEMASISDEQSLIEAQGWGRNTQGTVVLLAESSAAHSDCQRTVSGAF
ncbi:filamentous hemagglutinin family outer membrane protein [Leptolyngbya sp. Heron Island J]|nr:filamentous hemagglutinin family outer membrane protein [Leptolyngbya sp. Heron Island J]